jgi:hypothetical protein
MGGRMAFCLTILSASALIGCADAPTQTPSATAALAVTGTDSVALTYICGNMFRIRNASFEPRNVRWDIYNASPADTGSLWARGRDLGRTSVDFFVTSRTKGTMRLFVGTTLIATKANGNKAACAAPVDTTPLPSVRARGLDIDAQPRARDRNGIEVARNILGVRFSVVGSHSSQLRQFLRDLNAQVVRVLEPGFVYLRVPDPGTNPDSLAALELRARSAPSVVEAALVPTLAGTRTDGSRFPVDGIGVRPQDYIANSTRTWPAKAMRLNPAWWCENGAYDGPRVRVAVIEANFPNAIPVDLAASISVVRKARDPSAAVDSMRIDALEKHGVAVAGMIAAEGDNAIGTAGVVWRSDLTLFSVNQQSQADRATLEYVQYTLLPAVSGTNSRVLSLSTDFTNLSVADPAKRSLVERGVFLALRETLDSLPSLVIVKSAGNGSYTGSFASYPDSLKDLLLSSIVALKAEPNYADRVVLVGASTRSGTRAGFSNAFSNIVDLYAPGADVPVLTPTDSLTFTSGTSFSTPLVAGIAAQLIAMDGSLAPSEVKDLLLRGARDSVETANGDNVAPSRVGGVSDVVYEADAYGSLRLLSSRAGRPLCGAQVMAIRKQVTPNPLGNAPLELQIHRYAGAPVETITRDENNSPMYNDRSGNHVSVAPGGRAIALSSVIPFQGTATNLFNLTASGWVARPKRTHTLGIFYGERDTAIVDETGLVIFATRAGRQPPVPLPSGAYPFSLSFAPDGSALALVAGTVNPDGSEPKGIYVLRRDGTRDSAIANSANITISHRTAWAPDSRSVVMSIASSLLLTPTFRYYDSELFRYAVAQNSVAEIVRSSVYADQFQAMQSLNTTAEGGRTRFVIGSGDDLAIDSDCTVRSVSTNSLGGLRTELILSPPPCPSSVPNPGGGGGGMDGRIGRQKAPPVSASITRATRADTVGARRTITRP